VKVPTADDATTTVVTVRNPVVPSLVMGTTWVDSELMELYDIDVLVVTIVSGVNVDVDDSSLDDSDAARLVSLWSKKTQADEMRDSTTQMSARRTHIDCSTHSTHYSIR
jgi:hypothetical protein